MKLNSNDTFTTALPADPIVENTRRQVENACFSYVAPKKTAAPKLVHVSKEMATAIGITEEDSATSHFLKVMTGNEILPNTKPYAMCYGGHQFGNWAGQLGDGRAINLTEVVHNDKRWAIQLKGAGETPYSRTADGLAVLRSSIREYLCSEAMYHLGVPTTRALSLALTGDRVLRDVMYDGNSAYEKGAIVARVAPSFIRFGNFEILASRGDVNTLKQLADYTITHFFPEIKTTGTAKYVDLFKAVSTQSLTMVMHWQRVGFVHGVMNTDNMSILGLTIDYGPYGWLEEYDPGWTPNTTDRQHKRYRYGAQSQVVLWNLYQLANALYPLIEDAEPLEAVLKTYQDSYGNAYIEIMTSKIGLFSKDKNDPELIANLEQLLHRSAIDMTIFFRTLAVLPQGDMEATIALLKEASYQPEKIVGVPLQDWKDWFIKYDTRLAIEQLSVAERVEKMNAINPKYVLRNYMAQLAIDAADQGDFSIVEELYTLLKNPYDEQPTAQKWFAKRPDWANDKVGCSMLSCSS